ncbi:MAG: histidine phosphatase family protein [Alphaproteobacteria bacterium]|nr:histidine phosphatase family protein [Alphaproteobacteria bacterium]
MKDLLLMRHAKAVASAPDRGDHERALNGRGRRAAAAVARELRRLDARPDMILCSPARRTRETLAEFLDVYAPPPPTSLEPELYLAEAGQLLARFRRIEPGVRCALLIGHNEGLAQIAIALAGTGAPAALASMRSKFPTGAVAWLRFAIDDWADISPAGGELVAFVRPRDLIGGA